MGINELKALAMNFQIGWNEALEKTAEIIDDYRFSHDKFENLAIRKDLKNELKQILKSDYSLSDVNVGVNEQ